MLAERRNCPDRTPDPRAVCLSGRTLFCGIVSRPSVSNPFAVINHRKHAPRTERFEGEIRRPAEANCCLTTGDILPPGGKKPALAHGADTSPTTRDSRT